MNTFLKVVVLLIVALIVVKVLPLMFGLVCMLAAGMLGLIVMGGSAFAALVGSVVVLAVVMSPLWVPVLLIVGLIALAGRGTRRSGGVAV